mmetsp:Transcript_51987/g.156007  ORF Transcript_51987/g.156007 Transcript_51987/m.156007 type:complete len:262 (+) Transcript_51987:228-1013(+)
MARLPGRARRRRPASGGGGHPFVLRAAIAAIAATIAAVAESVVPRRPLSRPISSSSSAAPLGLAALEHRPAPVGPAEGTLRTSLGRRDEPLLRRRLPGAAAAAAASIRYSDGVSSRRGRTIGTDRRQLEDEREEDPKGGFEASPAAANAGAGGGPPLGGPEGKGRPQLRRPQPRRLQPQLRRAIFSGHGAEGAFDERSSTATAAALPDAPSETTTKQRRWQRRFRRAVPGGPRGESEGAGRALLLRFRRRRDEREEDIRLL